MSQTEKRRDTQPVQLVSVLLAGALLAFGVSVLVLFCAAHLVAAGTLGEEAAAHVEAVAAALGCLCGGVYAALSYRGRMLALGLLTGAAFYGVWTVIGLVGYRGVGVLDGVRNLMAALAGGVTAGLLCAWLRPGRK